MGPLYKFIGDPPDAEFILKGSLKFTPIPELNDPSELLPRVVRTDIGTSLLRFQREGYGDDDLQYLRQQGNLLRKFIPLFKLVPLPQTKEDANNILKLGGQFAGMLYESLVALLEEAAQEISSKVGLLCLTRRCDSLPMWAYYAKNASGVAVEFHGLDEAFSGDETGVLKQPVAVRYERGTVGVTFDPRSHETLFFSKFDDWRHEQEIRVIMPLEDCHRISIGERNLHVFEVPRKHVSRVIIGWRATADHCSEVIELVKSNNPNVRVVKARVENGQVYFDRQIYPRVAQ